MLIRSAQLQLFQQRAEDAFEVRVAEVLQARYAETVAELPPVLLRERVRLAIARARAHGFTWQSSIMGFVVMMFELGPCFDTHPSFARALAIRLRDENARIEAIYANVTDEDWQDAVSFADPDGWTGAVLRGG